MKYDATYHQNVVNNLRRGFVARYGYPLTITDADVWRIYQENFGVEVEGSDDPELAIYEELQNEEDFNSLC